MSNLIKCDDCGKEISRNAAACPNCGNPMSKPETNNPKCPSCGASDFEKISFKNKAGSALVFGIFSLGHVAKTFKCKSCGYKW